jgi:hypothetical protein
MGQSARERTETAGAELIVRIMARGKRPSAERTLLAKFREEGGGSVDEFNAALNYAITNRWMRRRDDGVLLPPLRAGLRAAGLSSKIH